MDQDFYAPQRESIYSRTSVARTLMARLPRLFRTRFCFELVFESLGKNPIAAELE